ncbi:hypothetical protein HNY73_016012 [Argiope bruennichi]|uniref:Uncharacterized protein n=1 Tax=Argiope bruennichi TaxID=94029 RepID=A0A8T0EIJ5_ARGBR|nr:hypothetical protein HNY73_016012 [Argiope bruennichi]
MFLLILFACMLLVHGQRAFYGQAGYGYGIRGYGQGYSRYGPGYGAYGRGNVGYNYGNALGFRALMAGYGDVYYAAELDTI